MHPRERPVTRRASRTRSATTRPSSVAGVLLEEVAGVLDDRVRRGRGCRGPSLLQHRRHRAGDRVAVAERDQERLVPARPAPPRPPGWPRSPGRRGGSAPASASPAGPPWTPRRGTARRTPRGPRRRARAAQPGRDEPADVEHLGPSRRRGGTATTPRASSKSPVGRPVLAATTAANRSGCSATRRSPISPPQSWPTSVTSRRSSASKRQRAHPLDVPGVACGRPAAVGLSERPKPTRSGATARIPASASTRMTWR